MSVFIIAISLAFFYNNAFSVYRVEIKLKYFQHFTFDNINLINDYLMIIFILNRKLR